MDTLPPPRPDLRARAIAPDDAPPSPVPPIDSARLLQGRREIVIRHGNETYRLRHTRNDKLILTK
jgi:hemin uptake protein HemP